MKGLPELKSHYAGMSKGYVICKKKGDFPFTASEAGEIVRRCKAYPEKEKQVDLLTLGLLQEKNHISAIQKQYDKDVFYLCENKPPELFSGWNACLSCKLRVTCRLLFGKPKSPCLSCKGSGLKTDENGVVEDDVCPECDGEK